MRLDDVRGIKAVLAADLGASPELVVSRDLGAALPAGPTREAARLRPGIALGVAPAGGGEYRLAVRVQRRDLLAGPALGRIRAATRGEIDVAYMGAVTKRQSLAGMRDRVRPLRIGLSVAHRDVTAGTIGALLRDTDGDGWLLLSNNHVLANENRARLGDEVLQPGPADGGRRPADVIGLLDRFVPLARDGINLVDAALAAVDPEIAADAAEIEGLGALSGTADQAEVVEVAKLGRTTGPTRGRITAFEVDNVVVSYDLGLLRFDDQIEISGEAEAFSAGGDSGSLVVATEGGSAGDGEVAAVGLLFAGSDQGGPDGLGVTFANPIATVLERVGGVEPTGTR